MGAQQAKERGAPSGASVRAARGKPRVPKDPRTLGSNIFTEHSGQYLNSLCRTATLGREDVAYTKQHEQRISQRNNVLSAHCFCIVFTR